jgi:hypothetical protein
MFIGNDLDILNNLLKLVQSQQARLDELQMKYVTVAMQIRGFLELLAADPEGQKLVDRINVDAYRTMLSFADESDDRWSIWLMAAQKRLQTGEEERPS